MLKLLQINIKKPEIRKEAVNTITVYLHCTVYMFHLIKNYRKSCVDCTMVVSCMVE